MKYSYALSALAFSAVGAAADTTSAAGDNPYATYPSVPKSASINGFADRIFDLLPECARDCVRESTGSTPCPYWDTGCLCVMPQWGAAVAQCFVDKCQGSDVHAATSLAVSQCSSAGVWEPYWMIPASLSTALDQAATAAATATTTDEGTTSSPVETTVQETSAPKETTAPGEATTEVAETSAAVQEPVTKVAETSSAVDQPVTEVAETSGIETSAAGIETSSSSAAAETSSSAAAETSSSSAAAETSSSSAAAETTPVVSSQVGGSPATLPSFIIVFGGIVGAMFV